MNRRALAWVSAAVVSIIAGAWWLSTLPAEVSSPPPPVPVVERVEPPAPLGQPVLPAPPTVLAAAAAPGEPDAGATAEVEIEVIQNGNQLIGVRVELEGPGGRVSRPTDVMGFARFTLATGPWRITAPRLPERLFPYDGGSRQDWAASIARTTSVPLEITAPLTRFRLELPVIHRFRGRVVDGRGQLVRWAEVRSGAFSAPYRVFSDHLGEFTVESTAPTLPVQASLGGTRSMVRTAKPDDVITLVLEEWTQLRVTTAPDLGGRLFVRVMHRDELVAAGCDRNPIEVPVGNLSVLARQNLRGRAHSGRARVDAKAGIENQLEIELEPTPPISGTLVDENGRPMPGVGVHLRQVEFGDAPAAVAGRQPTLNALVRRVDGGVPSLSATTRTNHLGEFSWTPLVAGSPDPIFQVLAVELWQTRSDPVLVKLDDAPLQVVIEPASR